VGEDDNENGGDKRFRVIDRRYWARTDDDDDEPPRDDQPQTADATSSYVVELERKLAEKEQLLEEVLAAHREGLADLDGARGRFRREAAREAERERRSLLVEFLEVIDNLDRALDVGDEQRDPKTVLAGVDMVRDLFVGKLAAFGVTRLDVLGQRFDPSVHEALAVVPVDDRGRDGQVVGVIRQGYAIGQELLRPAGVAVARKQ
jgi:molecular chaperone GrpE